MKQYLLILLISVLVLLFPQTLLAAGFQLKTVGGLNVDGVIYDHLWYSNGNVTFSGIALADTQVTVTIDGTSNTISADSSGNWSYTASLAEGDHQVSFTSNESTISFTLTIGEVPEGVGSLPTAETPTVGIISPTVILLLLGTIVILSPVFLRKLLTPKI